VATGVLRGGKMCLQPTDDEGRQSDGPTAGTCLGRAGDQLFNLGSGTLRRSAELGRDGDSAVLLRWARCPVSQHAGDRADYPSFSPLS
jgi:hypothetical protein